MLKFLDGPAKGVVLACSRAPLFLRVTEQTKWAGSEKWDALDQLNDCPKPYEKVYVYLRSQSHGSVHYDGINRQGRRFGRTEEVADYVFLGPQPDDATVRNQQKWREWAAANAEALKAKTGQEYELPQE